MFHSGSNISFISGFSVTKGIDGTTSCRVKKYSGHEGAGHYRRSTALTNTYTQSRNINTPFDNKQLCIQCLLRENVEILSLNTCNLIPSSLSGTRDTVHTHQNTENVTVCVCTKVATTTHTYLVHMFNFSENSSIHPVYIRE